MNVIIRGERTDERPTVDLIIDEVFEDPRIRNIFHTLWTSRFFNSDLSVVADRGNHLMGYALYFPVIVQGNGVAYKAVHMAPIAVRAIPDKQAVGERLVRHGIQRAHSLGHEIVLVMGPVEYFSPFGFRLAKESGFEANLPISEDAFMVHLMDSDNFGKLAGTVLYPPGVVS